MSLRINTNTEAMVGYLNLQKNQGSLASSLQRLSSGLRINKAADDAAGLVISEQMRAQITGMNQAISNSETAVNMVQTAEGALDEMNSLLKKVRSLALHAANAAPNDISQKVADQNELDNAISSISRISQTTQFGTKKLLDGTLAAANSYDTAKVYKIDVGSALMTRSDFAAGQVILTIDSSAETNTRTTFSNSALTGVLQGGANTAPLAATNVSIAGITAGIDSTTIATFTAASVAAQFQAAVGGLQGASAMSAMFNGVSIAIGNATSTILLTSAVTGMAAADTSLANFFATATDVLGGQNVGLTVAPTGTVSLQVAISGAGGSTAAILLSNVSVFAQASMTVNVGTQTFTFANGTTVASIVTGLNANTQGVSFTIGAAASGGLITTMRQAGATAVPSITINVAWHARATANYTANLLNNTSATSVTGTISYDLNDFAASVTTAMGGAVTSFGHNLATTIRLDGTSTITGITLGASNGDTANGVFTAVDGAAPANTLAATFGGANNVLKAGASVAISVAGKDYQFSNGETVSDMLSTINGAQKDYTLTSDKTSGLVAVRNKIGEGGSVTDLAIRVTDVGGKTGSLTQLSGDGVKFENLANGAAGIDYGINVKAHLSGTGLPSGNIYLNSTGDDASILTNSAYGLKITTNAAYTRLANDTVTGVGSTVTANLTQGASFQVGPNGGQLAAVDIKAVNASQLGLGGDTTGMLKSLQDLTGKQALVNGLSQEALAVIDQAIDDVTVMRGQLGAFQANALESGLNSLRSTQENLSSAESTIRDTDFAKESTSFSRNQILVQSSTSMLAQANQLSQSVLKLLGG